MFEDIQVGIKLQEAQNHVPKGTKQISFYPKVHGNGSIPTNFRRI